jgi:diadenosine tetraphosphate (Ap4A) HIT family hydrolase/predicted house-cleaning noncanonical NTP pyrophosphatase (MazG superfamily)
MSLKRFKVGKLIRDHLPDLMRIKGIVVDERAMDQDEFIVRLKDKLLEEAKEVNDSQNMEELAEELADILEVVQSIANATGLTMQQIEQKRLEKRVTKGGFDRKIYSHSVAIEENNPVIAQYLEKSHQYPEINGSEHNPDCLFCQIVRQERAVKVLAKFRHCYAIKDQFPVSNGHVLIIPNEHTENWFTAREEVRLDIIQALHYIKELLDKEYKPQGYNIGANCGDAAGQTVMHLHVHLIPRYQGDMEDPRGGVRGVIPSKQKY